MTRRIWVPDQNIFLVRRWYVKKGKCVCASGQNGFEGGSHWCAILAPTISKQRKVFLSFFFIYPSSLTIGEAIEGRENARGQEQERNTTG